MIVKNHKCWEIWKSKSQTFVLLIRICQFKCTAVNHPWLKWERTKVYCREIVVRDFYRGVRIRRLPRGLFLCHITGCNRIKNDFYIFRTKHELKMSNEKNENLQNVSFIHDSSLLLIRCMMSHIYSINFTKRIWLAVIPSLLQIHILSRVFKMTLTALSESNRRIRQPIREWASSISLKTRLSIRQVFHSRR